MLNPIQNQTCDLDLPKRRPAASGILGGACAGAVMAVALAWHSHSRLEDPSLPFRLISGGTALTGLLIHFAISCALGAVFSALIQCHVPGSSSEEVGDRTLVSGAIFGAAVWAIATYAVLPWLNPGFRAHALETPGWWFLFHVIYGGMLLLVIAFRKSASARRARSREAHLDKAA